MVMHLTADELTSRAEARRAARGAALEVAGRAASGQFFTPAPTAAFMADMFTPVTETVRILDPGAGTGSLLAAAVARWAAEGMPPPRVTGIERDPGLTADLDATLADCQAAGATTHLEETDFIGWAMARVGGLFAAREQFDLVIMNPPYLKLSSQSPERSLLSGLGLEVTNLYAAFVALAVRLLGPGGQLVAITPRSFCNGTYFRSFRRDLLSHVSLRRVHAYDARDAAFADASVLQETVIFHAVRDGEPTPVMISTSSGSDDAITTRLVPQEEVVSPNDAEVVIWLTPDATAAKVTERMDRLPCRLEQLGISVSTGRVVDFRCRSSLRAVPEEDAVPLIYPQHFSGGQMRWPKLGGRKPNALHVDSSTASMIHPSGCYVLVKRFSAKEERRRVTAAVVRTEHLNGQPVAFENHLNVFHRNGAGLEPYLAVGLATFLNSTIVDLHFRQVSGHTQVNARDLRRLRYPTCAELTELGQLIGDAGPDQAKVDQLAEEHVAAFATDEHGSPLSEHRRIGEARDVLAALGLPKAQRNERSALVLLALLNLTPDKPWSDSEAPLIGITPMMDFMAEHYGKAYAPNSRETVRRQTVHQFMSAGLVVQNSDDPARPINSGKNVYQVPLEVLVALRSFGESDWELRLKVFQRNLRALADRWAAERAMLRLPLTLPDGSEVSLSAGGQNILIKQIIEEFCPRFAPGGHLLYIGDAEEKWARFESSALAGLGVVVNEHGKMPDVVVHHVDRDWLLLIEAVTSHGPVDPKRHDELASVFAKSSAGLVFVSAFPDLRVCSRFLGQIAWETEVWIAESPSHLVHFNGARFLGPHE